MIITIEIPEPAKQAVKPVKPIDPNLVIARKIFNRMRDAYEQVIGAHPHPGTNVIVAQVKFDGMVEIAAVALDIDAARLRSATDSAFRLFGARPSPNSFRSDVTWANAIVSNMLYGTGLLK